MARRALDARDRDVDCGDAAAAAFPPAGGGGSLKRTRRSEAAASASGGGDGSRAAAAGAEAARATDGGLVSSLRTERLGLEAGCRDVRAAAGSERGAS